MAASPTERFSMTTLPISGSEARTESKWISEETFMVQDPVAYGFSRAKASTSERLPYRAERAISHGETRMQNRSISPPPTPYIRFASKSQDYDPSGSCYGETALSG